MPVFSISKGGGAEKQVRQRHRLLWTAKSKGGKPREQDPSWQAKAGVLKFKPGHVHSAMLLGINLSEGRGEK